jgi:hypothetical protein
MAIMMKLKKSLTNEKVDMQTSIEFIYWTDSDSTRLLRNRLGIWDSKENRRWRPRERICGKLSRTWVCNNLVVVGTLGLVNHGGWESDIMRRLRRHHQAKAVDEWEWGTKRLRVGHELFDASLHCKTFDIPTSSHSYSWFEVKVYFCFLLSTGSLSGIAVARRVMSC